MKSFWFCCAHTHSLGCCVSKGLEKKSDEDDDRGSVLQIRFRNGDPDEPLQAGCVLQLS